MRKRISYSQNFLENRDLVSYLVGKSSISKEDTVFDIGAGQGIITEELLRRAKRVAAFEIDPDLFNKLSQRFQNEKSLELIRGNFLTCKLPSQPYKVFSNIPFNLTAEIIKKLAQTQNPPEDTYLIVQNEAANKFAGKPIDNKNSQMAILLKPRFDFEIFHQFKVVDFFPRPSVDIIMLRIKKKDKPLVGYKQESLYEDFVTYAFNQFKPDITEGLSKVFGKGTIIKLAGKLGFPPSSKPSELDIEDWIGLFNAFTQLNGKYQSIVRGSYANLLSQQGKLEKIHRTRTDKSWKKYAK